MASEISRRDLQAAISKAVELRALHAALTHGSNSSPASLRMPPEASPCLISRISGGDYPVFTPSYGDDPFPGHRNLRSDHRTLSETWTGRLVEGGERTKEDEVIRLYWKKSPCVNGGSQPITLSENHESITTKTTSCLNHIGPPPNLPGRDSFKFSRPTNSTELATCNECKPATISVEDGAGDSKKKKTKDHRRTTTMSTDTQSSVQLPLKTRPSIVSWLFPRPKKTSWSETVESEDMSKRLSNDHGIQTLELLKKELREASTSRDVALAEAGEMRSTLEDLKTKMIQLETYCKDLKNAYRPTMQGRESPAYETHRRRVSGRKKPIGGGGGSRVGSSSSSNSDITMPVSYEVMVEGFLQIVSEARLSVTQFCKALINPITGVELPQNLSSLLLFSESSSTSSTRSVRGEPPALHQLEAVITQSLYQDFENCVFQNNGYPKSLNPRKKRQENFSTFVSLRNLTWNEVLGKGTNDYSDDFSKFCDVKMSRIVSLLEDRSRPWHEELLHSFFVSTKCIWLVHLLAFSFDPPLAILRVGENWMFDSAYMKDVRRVKGCANARVKVMVTPGFYVREKVLKCKVFCTYQSS